MGIIRNQTSVIAGGFRAMLRLITDSENPHQVWLSALSNREPRDGCRGLPSSIPGAAHPRPCLSGPATLGLLLTSSDSLEYRPVSRSRRAGADQRERAVGRETATATFFRRAFPLTHRERMILAMSHWRTDTLTLPEAVADA